MENLWTSQAFSELRKEWYAKLEGFSDIERFGCPDESLMVWHSTEFLDPLSRQRSAAREEYKLKIDAFANDHQFPEILVKMTSHFNSKFSPAGVEEIWTLHREGRSERNIADQMMCSRSCITFLLRRMREWMHLIA